MIERKYLFTAAAIATATAGAGYLARKRQRARREEQSSSTPTQEVVVVHSVAEVQSRLEEAYERAFESSSLTSGDLFQMVDNTIGKPLRDFVNSRGVESPADGSHALLVAGQRGRENNPYVLLVEVDGERIHMMRWSTDDPYAIPFSQSEYGFRLGSPFGESFLEINARFGGKSYTILQGSGLQGKVMRDVGLLFLNGVGDILGGNIIHAPSQSQR